MWNGSFLVQRFTPCNGTPVAQLSSRGERTDDELVIGIETVIVASFQTRRRRLQSLGMVNAERNKYGERDLLNDRQF